MINVTMWLWGRGSTLLPVTGFEGVGTTWRGAPEHGIPVLKRDTLYAKKAPQTRSSTLPPSPTRLKGTPVCAGAGGTFPGLRRKTRAFLPPRGGKPLYINLRCRGSLPVRSPSGSEPLHFHWKLHLLYIPGRYIEFFPGCDVPICSGISSPERGCEPADPPGIQGRDTYFGTCAVGSPGAGDP